MPLSPFQLFIGLLIVGFCLTMAGHALMRVREPRAAFGWAASCLFLPIVGGVLYALLGVNRIETKAQRWKERGRFDPGHRPDYQDLQAELSREHPERADRVGALLDISAKVSGRPLFPGNAVAPLYNGDAAYPPMLEAIANATERVYLCSYLFDSGPVGMRFVDALGAAAARGVDVRVIVDAIGERYGPGARVSKYLTQRDGIKVTRFLPLSLSLRGLAVNMRTHRKILAIDGRVGFTGGMNIGKNNLLSDPSNTHPIADLHFRFEGPIVYTLEDVFLEDWYFCTNQRHEELPPRPSMEAQGRAVCRGISDGPNEDYEVLTWVLVGALGVARERARIMTPYFIPSPELLAALNSAALRGVRVDVVLPRKGNLPLVDWAVQDRLQDVLLHGIRVYRQPDPFNHTKLLVVDDFYVNLGSANLDPRSLRLNFEFNVEVYDDALAESLAARYDEVLARSTEVTMAMLARRSFLVKLRDSLAKLVSPYL